MEDVNILKGKRPTNNVGGTAEISQDVGTTVHKGFFKNVHEISDAPTMYGITKGFGVYQGGASY